MTNYTWRSRISSGHCTGLECSAGICQNCWFAYCVQVTVKNAAVSGIFQRRSNMIAPVVTVAVICDTAVCTVPQQHFYDGVTLTSACKMVFDSEPSLRGALKNFLAVSPLPKKFSVFPSGNGIFWCIFMHNASISMMLSLQTEHLLGILVLGAPAPTSSPLATPNIPTDLNTVSHLKKKRLTSVLTSPGNENEHLIFRELYIK